MEFIVLFLIITILGVWLFRQKKYTLKNTTVKKEEIIIQYEKELKTLLRKYENNKSSQVEQKKIFLQNCNNELSRNIFFTEEESIKIIERLLKL